MNKSFPKSKRVVSSQHFTLVLKRGGCAADDCLVVFALPASPESSIPRRLGVTIPKKTGNAVQRNQWKRWIREAFRVQQDQLPDGYDFIVRPKKGAKGSWDKIQRSIATLSHKSVARIRKA